MQDSFKSVKLAVIVPVYNAIDYLQECLESIESQTFYTGSVCGGYEVIVVDNESTDGSREFAESFCKERGWDFDSVPNIYPASWEEPVTRALEMMSDDVDFFTIVGADDYLDPLYLQNNCNILNSLLDQKVILNSPIFFQGTLVKKKMMWKSAQLREYALTTCPAITPTCFYHRSLGDPEYFVMNSKECYGAGDYWMFCHLIDKGVNIVTYHSNLGYNYRSHKNQSTWLMKEQFGGLIDKKIQDYWRQEWEVRPRQTVEEMRKEIRSIDSLDLGDLEAEILNKIKSRKE